MTTLSGASSIHGNEDHIDGCTCDIELDETDAVSDAELPVSTGGVQLAGAAQGNEDGVDGCDVDFNSADVTPDAELPPAVGGVDRTL